MSAATLRSLEKLELGHKVFRIIVPARLVENDHFGRMNLESSKSSSPTGGDGWHTCDRGGALVIDDTRHDFEANLQTVVNAIA